MTTPTCITCGEPIMENPGAWNSEDSSIAQWTHSLEHGDGTNDDEHEAIPA